MGTHNQRIVRDVKWVHDRVHDVRDAAAAQHYAHGPAKREQRGCICVRPYTDDASAGLGDFGIGGDLERFVMGGP